MQDKFILLILILLKPANFFFCKIPETFKASVNDEELSIQLFLGE